MISLSAPLQARAQTQIFGGYAGQQARDIKALSAEEQADLLAGQGMGLARAGELNNHPGPAHVLALRDSLALTPAQTDVVQASFRRMEDAAKPLGAELVRLERAMDDSFRQRAMTLAQLAADTGAIGMVQARLRAVHLQAHLEIATLPSTEQIAAYVKLRSYGEAGPLSRPETGLRNRSPIILARSGNRTPRKS